MTSTNRNKELVRRFYEQVVAGGHVELLETLAASNMIDHTAAEAGWPEGRAGFVQHVKWVHGAITDRDVSVDDLVAEGDRVVAFWTLNGVHSGEFFGVPATGKQISATAVSVLTIEDDQIAEYVVRPDVLSLLQQLGAFPS